jgi:hypothetical protein
MRLRLGLRWWRSRLHRPRRWRRGSIDFRWRRFSRVSWSGIPDGRIRIERFAREGSSVLQTKVQGGVGVRAVAVWAALHWLKRELFSICHLYSPAISNDKRKMEVTKDKCIGLNSSRQDYRKSSNHLKG